MGRQAMGRVGKAGVGRAVGCHTDMGAMARTFPMRTPCSRVAREGRRGAVGGKATRPCSRTRLVWRSTTSLAAIPSEMQSLSLGCLAVLWWPTTMLACSVPICGRRWEGSPARSAAGHLRTTHCRPVSHAVSLPSHCLGPVRVRRWRRHPCPSARMTHGSRRERSRRRRCAVGRFWTARWATRPSLRSTSTRRRRCQWAPVSPARRLPTTSSCMHRMKGCITPLQTPWPP